MDNFLKCNVISHLVEKSDYKTATKLAFAFGANEGKMCIDKNELIHLQVDDMLIITEHNPQKMPYAQPYTNDWGIVEDIKDGKISISIISCAYYNRCPYGFIKTKPVWPIVEIDTMEIEVDKDHLIFSKKEPRITKGKNKNCEINLLWIDKEIVQDGETYITIPAYDSTIEALNKMSIVRGSAPA